MDYRQRTIMVVQDLIQHKLEDGRNSVLLLLQYQLVFLSTRQVAKYI